MVRDLVGDSVGLRTGSRPAFAGDSVDRTFRLAAGEIPVFLAKLSGT